MMGDRQPAYIEAKRFLPMLENMLKRSRRIRSRL